MGLLPGKVVLKIYRQPMECVSSFAQLRIELTEKPCRFRPPPPLLTLPKKEKGVKADEGGADRRRGNVDATKGWHPPARGQQVAVVQSPSAAARPDAMR